MYKSSILAAISKKKAESGVTKKKWSQWSDKNETHMQTVNMDT